uniref:Uncharacterized protein n=1 Tax=viral metagenome TaxID=1070528 RepID=A0A6C0LLH0_9ZZZZ
MPKVSNNAAKLKKLGGRILPRLNEIKEKEFAIVCHCSNSRHQQLHYIQNGIMGDKIGVNIKYIDPLCPEDTWDKITKKSLRYIWGIYCPIYTSYYDSNIITQILNNSFEKLKLNGMVLFPALEDKNIEYFTNNPFAGFTFSKLHINQLSFIIDKHVPTYTEYYVFTKENSAKPKKAKPSQQSPKKCPDGKVLNPATGRCILSKNAAKATKAVVKKSPKKCPDGKVLNPATGRCILSKNAAKAAKAVVKKSPKKCPDGKVLNPATGRCILLKNAMKAAGVAK